MPESQETKRQERFTLNSLADLQTLFTSVLHDNNNIKIEETIGKIEQKTNINREKFVIAIGGLLCAYMIFGALAEIVCNAIGFAYPAYASVKAVRTQQKDDDTRWLIYWTVFASFSLVDFFAEYVMKYFPIYWVLKALFLLYLYLPQTYGAQTLYESLIDPTITKIDQLLEKYNNPKQN
uniref:Receptor expression-enhancing protein n=1 Tax=Ascaris suum TaxID=6253 RepID=F1LEB1_ASCSU